MIKNRYDLKSIALGNYLDQKLFELKKSNKKIFQIKGEGCLRGIIFDIDLNFFKLFKIIPNSFFKNKLFLKKLIVVSIMEELYSKYNILTTFKDNKNITLCRTNFSYIRKTLIISLKA